MPSLMHRSAFKIATDFFSFFSQFYHWDCTSREDQSDKVLALLLLLFRRGTVSQILREEHYSVKSVSLKVIKIIEEPQLHRVCQQIFCTWDMNKRMSKMMRMRMRTSKRMRTRMRRLNAVTWKLILVTFPVHSSWQRGGIWKYIYCSHSLSNSSITLNLRAW